MSILAMNLVWQHYHRGGSEKLALLALADWCDDHGGSLYPSVNAVARKICASESQARRLLHGFINDGLLEVVGNHNGGAKSQTRHYRLNLIKLSATPSVYATPSTHATPCMDAHDPLHGCALPLAPMTPNTSLTIKEPSEVFTPSKIAEKRKAKPSLTLQAFLDLCKAEGIAPIPYEDSIFAYATETGLPEGAVELAWFKFKDKHLQTKKTQKDWRAHFRNAVKDNWYKLWYLGNDGDAGFTTAGRQAQRELAAKTREPHL